MKTIVYEISALILLFISIMGGCKTPTTAPNSELNDTTNNDFAWQKWEFGRHSSSALYDVAIINENDIWAVGEIYLNDSTGQPDPHAYNAVHWDGQKWEAKRIYFPTVCGQTSLTSYPGGSIFNFNDGEIWITSTGDKIARLKNNIQVDKFCLPSSLGMSINKIWGTSSSDLYVVGNNGSVAHYDGNTWLKIDSRTNLNICDINGSNASDKNNYEIIAVASNWIDSHDRRLFKITGNVVQMLNTKPMVSSIVGTWFISNQKYYAIGDGAFYKSASYLGSEWTEISDKISNYYLRSIDGQAANDIVCCGDYGDVIHFNGITWKSFFNETSLNLGSYLKVKIKGNKIISVGYKNGKAVISLGVR